MLVSVVYWLYKMEDTSVLLIGFWVWVTGYGLSCHFECSESKKFRLIVFLASC